MQHARIILFMLICLSLATIAHAHRVNIFAWVEGDRIFTESSYPSGNKAQGAKVSATSAKTGELFAEGETNKNGLFVFPVPAKAREQKTNIVLTLHAGEGHANTWEVLASEFLASDALTQPQADETSSAQYSINNTDSNDKAESKNHTAASSQLTMQGVSEQQIRTIVSEELEKKLGPLRRQLAAKQAAGPELQDVVGGIGWILGIFGAAALARSRRQR